MQKKKKKRKMSKNVRAKHGLMKDVDQDKILVLEWESSHLGKREEKGVV